MIDKKFSKICDLLTAKSVYVGEGTFRKGADAANGRQ